MVADLLLAQAQEVQARTLEAPALTQAQDQEAQEVQAQVTEPPMECTLIRLTRTQHRHTTPITQTGKLISLFTHTTGQLIIIIALGTTPHCF